MNLSTYLKRKRINARKLADLVGVPASTITRIIRGERSPTLAIMIRISEATGGSVSKVEDFLPAAKENDEAA
jgi:transcriptional regulator with XRE-family HTH domain